MQPAKWIIPLFVIAALYEGILGLGFLALHKSIFEYFNVTPPNHPAYVQFPALLLLLFAAMFVRVARNPRANRELILYGAGLKTAYCALAFGYQFTAGIPAFWIPFAWADLVFLLLFAIVWFQLKTPSAREG